MLAQGILKFTHDRGCRMDTKLIDHIKDVLGSCTTLDIRESYQSSKHSQHIWGQKLYFKIHMMVADQHPFDSRQDCKGTLFSYF